MSFIGIDWREIRPLSGVDRNAVDQPDEEGDQPGAVQSFKDECDINNIMAKFQRTGALEWVQKYEGQYGDVTGISFDKAMETVLKAQEMFDDLPSSVRDRFMNSPSAFLEFLGDESNRAEAEKLGLVIRKPVEPVQEVPGGKT